MVSQRAGIRRWKRKKAPGHVRGAAALIDFDDSRVGWLAGGAMALQEAPLHLIHNRRRIRSDGARMESFSCFVLEKCENVFWASMKKESLRRSSQRKLKQTKFMEPAPDLSSER